MKYLTRLFLILMAIPVILSSTIQTDHAVFLFDNGDKNMIASMLRYAYENDPSTLENLDFRIIFMGASVDAMSQEPFCHYPQKLVHYRQLGITESIDHNWKRDQKLIPDSINKLSNLEVRRSVWMGVSCSIFEQLIDYYQNKPNIEVIAVRDNPSPHGDTDYFRVAEQVQNKAHKIAVPSQAVYEEMKFLGKEVLLVGHAPIEEWQAEALKIDKDAIIEKLGLRSHLPIIVYAGVYGEFYKSCLELFLDIVPIQDVELLIVPHPRYQGLIEREVCRERNDKCLEMKIVGEFVTDPSKKIRTVEALAVADIVVTADPTSTIVFQANALNKKVLYVNPKHSETSKNLCRNRLLYSASTTQEFRDLIRNAKAEQMEVNQDIFTLLGIPRHGAKLLWDLFTNTAP